MNRVGSRSSVMHRNAYMTGGGLKKKDLKYNKHGKIVSKRMSAIAKKEKRLQKAGYITEPGVFRLFQKQRGGAAQLNTVHIVLNDLYDYFRQTPDSSRTPQNFIKYLERMFKTLSFLSIILNNAIKNSGGGVHLYRYPQKYYKYD